MLLFPTDIHYEDTWHRTVDALKNSSEARLVSRSIHQLRRVHLWIFMLLDSGDGDVQIDHWKHSGSRMPASAPAIPRATRPPSAPWPYYTGPTHQPPVTPAKTLPPMTDSASGAYWETPSPGQIVPSPARGWIGGKNKDLSICPEPFPSRARRHTIFNMITHTRYKIDISHRIIKRK